MKRIIIVSMTIIFLLAAYFIIKSSIANVNADSDTLTYKINSPDNIINNSDTSGLTRLKLKGFWITSFPVSDDESGYIFLEDGRYLNYNIWDLDYFGGMGIWRISGKKIYIWPKKDIWNTDYYFDDNDLLIVLKRTIKDSQYSEWKLIGDLVTYQELEPSAGDDPGAGCMPERLNLRFIANGELEDEATTMYRIKEEPDRVMFYKFVLREYNDEFESLQD